MFVVSNYGRSEGFAVRRRNNLTCIEARIKSVSYMSTECNSPVQYFCVADVRGVVRREEMVASKFFAVETVYERPAVERQESGFETLVYDFGDRLSKERVKKREINVRVSTQTVKFNVENQLLPEFNRDASDVRDVYSIELMFGEKMVQDFRETTIEFDDLCQIAKSSSLNLSQERGECCLIIDCLYKILIGRHVQEGLVGPYRFFVDGIRGHINKGRLSTLAKDKLMVKFYVLLLLVNNYEVDVEQTPWFGEMRSKVVGMLKAIGCSVDKSGRAKLVNLPKSTFTTR